jgi:hypothetical protein
MRSFMEELRGSGVDKGFFDATQELECGRRPVQQP